MNVLSIGNSFSQDAQRYIHHLANKDGFEMRTANLYIGGCPLRTHYLNVLDDEKSYVFEFNGEGTGLFVSIKEALKSNEWDVITLQQASRFSVDFSTFTPYIEELVSYVRKYAPKAKIYIHQIWAYEKESARLESVGIDTPEEMLKSIVQSYNKASKLIKADGIIKCGEAMLELSKIVGKVHRDALHASLGAGRYLLALTWYKTLTGRDISNNDFNYFDEPVSQEQRQAVIEVVNKIVKKNTHYRK